MRTPSTPAEPAAAREQLAGKLIAATEQFLAPLRARMGVILGLVAQEHGVPVADLRRSTRAVLRAKGVAVALVAEFLNPPVDLDVLAAWLNISEGSLYRYKAAVRQRAAAEPAFAAHLDTLRERIRTALNIPTENPSNG